MARSKRQLSIKDCYEILRLQKGADLQAVKTAYRKRAFELHPDLNPGNADAQRQFQLLNEAYVALSAMLKPVEEAKQKAEAKKQAAGQEKTETKEESASGQAETGADQSEDKAAEANSSEKARAQQAYAEQDVLRDLLNDPFARRVFEDIYSEMAKKQKEEEKKQPTNKDEEKSADTKPKVETTSIKSSKPPHTIKLWERDSSKGVKGVLKNWFRKQIDEELHLTFPAARLAPGKKIPLTISYGLNNETQTVEVTIPKNFVAGKPMRLKGLGKRLGPLQGDLYLTIHSI